MSLKVYRGPNGQFGIYGPYATWTEAAAVKKVLEASSCATSSDVVNGRTFTYNFSTSPVTIKESHPGEV